MSENTEAKAEAPTLTGVQHELQLLRAWARADIALYHGDTTEQWQEREAARKLVHEFYGADAEVKG